MVGAPDAVPAMYVAAPTSTIDMAQEAANTNLEEAAAQVWFNDSRGDWHQLML
jgi:hypothetical protein